MRLRVPSLALLLLTFAASLACQQSTTPRGVLASSLAAMGGTMTRSISLSGNAKYVAGSTDDQGSFNAQCVVDGSSQLELQIPSFTHIETRTTNNGAHSGTWTDGSGKVHALAGHNAMTPAAWFCPSILVSTVLSNSALDVEYKGNELRDGHPVNHLVVAERPLDSTPVQAWMSRLTRSDLYLDAVTHRLIAVDFDMHPDRDATINMPVEVLFKDYANSGGVWAPTTIEKYVDSTLQLTLHVDSSEPSSQLATAN